MRGGSMMQLLLIEDSREIALAFRQVLATGYSITLAENGLRGLKYARNDSYDIIVLDLNLPDIPGLQVCEELRASGCNTPIIILTGETKVMNKIRLLDAGADDYLTKPFSLGELKARLRVLQRRGHTSTTDTRPLNVGELTLDKKKHQVERDGQTITLRRKEFALLECLMLHAGNVVSRSLLGNYAWQGADIPWTNTIDVHVKHLRDKIDRPFDAPLIQTVHGLGYKLTTQQPSTVLEKA
jgi:two-component system OmpR family response regulator